MKQYLDLVSDILENGSWQDNRTAQRTKSIHGAMMKFDLTKGFPAVTTKRLAFKSAIGEMVGFLRASQSASDFRALGSKVWDQNANENKDWLQNPFRVAEDSLGEIYGVQWRQWPAYKMIDLSTPNGEKQLYDALGKGFRLVTYVGNDAKWLAAPKALLYKPIDQLKQCLQSIVSNPGSRRILFHAWNPAQLDEMALPPCHLLYQFLVNQEKGGLSLCIYLRSNDVGLGAPFNLAASAALLHLVARLTGYQAKFLTYFIADAHIYENHIEMLKEQVTRTPLASPTLVISDRIPEYAKTGKFEPEWLDTVEPSDFSLEGYEHLTHLTAPMAV